MYKVIGDIHSRPHLLEQALQTHTEYFPVLLGDILDGRNNLSPKDKTKNDLETIKLLQKYPHQLIAGNHDLGLLNPKSKLTKDTCDRLEAKPEFNWLKYLIRVHSSTYLELNICGQKYQLAHAYPYASATKTEQSQGLKINNRRYKWYKEAIYDNSAIKICGHYHEIFSSPKAWVLDGDNNDNCLPVLLLDSKQSLIIFK